MRRKSRDQEKRYRWKVLSTLRLPDRRRPGRFPRLRVSFDSKAVSDKLPWVVDHSGVVNEAGPVVVRGATLQAALAGVISTGVEINKNRIFRANKDIEELSALLAEVEENGKNAGTFSL